MVYWVKNIEEFNMIYILKMADLFIEEEFNIVDISTDFDYLKNKSEG